MTLFGPESGQGAAPAIAGVARVAVERGVDRYPEGLTYALPPELADLRAGERVDVPLGRGDALVPGTVLGVAPAEGTPLPRGRIKFVAARRGGAPALPGQVVELAHWVSAYYACPIGVTLASVLPAAVKRGTGSTVRTVVELAPGWRDTLAAAKRVTAAQRAAVAVLEAAAPEDLPMEVRELCRRAGLGSPAPVKRLVHAGVLATERRTSIEAAWRQERTLAAPRPELTPEQRAIVEAVDTVRGAGFSQHLLRGVTGSGKTEVYMRLVERALQAGRTALVLVPEIALTPQTGGRLLGRFPAERVAILHSGLTAAQRNQQWNLVARGDVRIVMGARSAVFAPIPDGALGLVVVDEEHDASYKQDQQPRYHGRDVAIRRAQLAGCPVLLGSATPSLESWFNATERGVSTLHTLASRAPGLALPRVQVVDFAEERRHFPDQRVHLVGPTLAGAIQHTLREGGQVIVLLNRRGYANYIACADQRCGWMMRCDHCDAGMICHRTAGGGSIPAGEYVRCHHCGTEQRLPRACPQCGRGVSVFGFGVQRVEEQLHRLDAGLVPGRTMLRLDADTMRTAADFHEALGRFARGEARLLVGTQMIAKGLDFPGVRLVGVVNADTALNLPDFRAAERTFQLVSQVAGRCGRGADAGRAIVQTFQPDAPAVRLAAAHDFTGFAAEELALRRRFGLPPWRRMVRFVVRHEDEETARAEAENLARGLATLVEGRAVEIRGPSPCPIARIADRWRMQVEAFADTAAPLQRLLAAARNSGVLKPGETIATDVDPVALM
jgi:primosomal protein N' (replication factor Y)